MPNAFPDFLAPYPGTLAATLTIEELFVTRISYVFLVTTTTFWAIRHESRHIGTRPGGVAGDPSRTARSRQSAPTRGPPLERTQSRHLPLGPHSPPDEPSGGDFVTCA